MYEQLGVNAKVVQGSTFKVYVQPSIHCLYLIHAPEIYLKIAHGSTPVSTIFWKLVKFVIIDRIIFNKEITSRVARLHPRRMKQVNIMSELLRNPGNGYLRELKSKTFPRGGGCPWTPRRSSFRKSVSIYPRSALEERLLKWLKFLQWPGFCLRIV